MTAGPPRRLLPSLSLLSLVVYAALSALLAVLLPNQIAALDPERKVENLAAVTSVSFAFTIFAQPLVGALSDRTRGRFGRRVPWIIIGGVVAGAFLVGLGGLDSLLWIGVFWVIIQFALNAIDAPIGATVPDRYPRGRWGVASAVIGIGTMTGGAAGAVFASRLVTDLALVSACLGAAVIIGAVLFAIVNREPPVSAPAGPFRWRSFIAGFWVDPRQHPDFAIAFAARLVFILGYTLVYTFQLFVLTDHIGLANDEANALIGVLSVLTFVTTLIAVAVAGWWSDRLGRRKIFLLAAGGILIVALAVPSLAPSVTSMMVFAVVKGLAFGIILSVGAAVFAEVLPDTDAAAGKDLGILNVATNIPQAVSPLVGGLVIAMWGYGALFVVAIVTIAIATVLFSRLRGVR